MHGFDVLAGNYVMLYMRSTLAHGTPALQFFVIYSMSACKTILFFYFDRMHCTRSINHRNCYKSDYCNRLNKTRNLQGVYSPEPACMNILLMKLHVQRCLGGSCTKM